MSFNPNNSRDFAKQTQSPLQDGWYTCRLVSVMWFPGNRYNRMSFRYNVLQGFRQGKTFQANLTWGLTFTDPKTNEIISSDESSNKKLAILAEICGVDMDLLQGNDNPADWADMMNECSGTRMAVQIKFWSNEKVQEGYNLIQVRKA